jgi:hypothetical protein
MQHIETRGLLRPIFCGIFVVGHILGTIALILCLLGHTDILENRMIFGVHLFPDGIPTQFSPIMVGLLSLVAIVFGSGLYALGTWIVTVAGLATLNAITGVLSRKQK